MFSPSREIVQKPEIQGLEIQGLEVQGFASGSTPRPARIS
jgi:hypothetical protein